MNAVVRFAEPQEWERVRELRLRALVDSPGAFGSTYAAECEAVETDWRAWVQGWAGAANAMAVAEAGGTWVGMAVGSRTGEDPEAHLYAMWVEPAWRRHGLGRRLVEEVLAWARSWGAGAVVLGVTQGNDAERFYASIGFEDTGERHPLRDGSELTVRVLRRAPA